MGFDGIYNHHRWGVAKRHGFLTNTWETKKKDMGMNTGEITKKMFNHWTMVLKPHVMVPFLSPILKPTT